MMGDKSVHKELEGWVGNKISKRMWESVIHLEGKNREFGSYGTITATTYS